MISSGNVELNRLSRVIQRGLGASGRLLRFAVALPDNRSGLDNLAKAIYDESAVLKSVVTEQMWVHSDVGTTWVRTFYQYLLLFYRSFSVRIDVVSSFVMSV